MLFSALAAALFLLGSVQATCPAGTTFNSNFNKCYKYVSQPATYLVAEDSCKSMGGYLVTIGNSFENSYIAGVAGANSWIGLNYLLANTWTWVDGTSAPYSNWAPAQPSDPSTKQCALYNYGSGQWIKEMCNVKHAYVCDIDPNAIHGNSLNIPANPAADPNNAPQYAAFQQAVSEFKYSVNFSADPCNDFYNYACGNYKKLVSIYDMTDNNYNNMVSQLTSPAYQSTVQASTALSKEKKFFDACKTSMNNFQQDNQTRVQNNYLKTKVMKLQSLLGSPFTTVYGGSAYYPSPKQLANALGYLSFVEGIDTYISPYVDTYWRDNTKGNLFFVDQNTCELPKTYYAPNVFPTIKNSYIAGTVGVLQDYCSEQGIACPLNLNSKVQDLINFEQIIAYNYSTDDTTRRQANRNWNPQTFNQAQSTYSFIDWSAYISNIPYAAARSKVQAAGYNFDLMEPGMTQKLSKDLQGYGAEKVVNYLYMRLILDSSQYLPSYGSSFEKMPKLEKSPKIGIDRSDRKQKRKPISTRNKDSASPVEQQCIELADDLLQYANGRVFIDKIYPDQASRKSIRDTAGGLIKNVVNSFQGMLEQLDWMDDSTKLKALDKTNNIIKNIAFPDWITDNSQLDSYYSFLDLSSTTDFYSMWDLLIQFNIQLEYQKVMTVPADRNDFQAGPGVVNAWYQPEFNSITLAAGMLQPPFFQQNFPTSMNYGGIGIVSGHELTHGFDDQGVQWDPTGNLPSTPWMDTNSSTGFNQMAQCVISEYSNFCPLDAAKYTPNCINGAQTQGENIADNGGIHAAFRAYRTHIALDGPDPTLPDPIFGQFTHDQLFFLNYGQIWCEAPVSDGSVYRQIMTDPHSPALYRVFGSIQNFPAFRVAYNCPIGSSYSPVDHCRVWVPNVEN